MDKNRTEKPGRWPMLGVGKLVRKALYRTCIVTFVLQGLLAPRAYPESIPIEDLKQLDFVPNPSGVQIGFWANYRRSEDVLRDFGRRPLERVNFHQWVQVEKEPGQYRWNDCFRFEKQAHLAGSTVIGNVNLFFTRRLNKDGMDAIPSFYEQDIRDPATRAAARNFLTQFTKRMLEETGETWLLLDYEFLWFALPSTPEIRQAYRDWFVEAAALCRETARDMGKEELLKIGCCLNADPFDVAKHLIGSAAGPAHVPQQWLLDVVRTSDFVAVDTYSQVAGDPSSNQAFLNTVKFWIDFYAGDKPLFVTENGFSTAPEYGFTEKGYHARGTEAEQAKYFENLFTALKNRNSPELNFLKKVHSYCIWMYGDMDSEKNPLEDHFGLVRMDGSQKPAWQVVKAGIDNLERDSALSPSKLNSEKSFNLAEVTSKGVELTYHSGTEFEALQFSFKAPPEVERVELAVRTSTPSRLLALVDGKGWCTNAPRQVQNQSIQLPLSPNAKVQTVTLYFTAEKLPMTTRLESIEVQSVK